MEAKTGLEKSIVGRINKEMDEGKENNKAGHPPKLTPWDKQSICCQISSGKLDNAVQATYCWIYLYELDLFVHSLSF